MIDVVITSFKEPETISRAIDNFLSQDLIEDYKIWVVAPDKETIDIAKKYSKKYKKIIPFKDPGKGKSFALNLILPKLKGRIIVLSDGDVYVEKNTLKFIIEPFNNKEVGCVSGRPVSIEDKSTILGYWSHLLCDAGAHEARLKRFKKGEFLECSGYYWAFRNKVIKNFPTDVAEDTIIPFMFRDRGYKIAYAPKAIVYVAYPKNLSDFIEQKKRTAKGHESLSKYYDLSKLPRTKSFKNEILEGYRALFYPKKFKEFFYTLLFFPVRFYIWILVFYQTKLKKQHYHDAWKRVESTKYL